MLLREREIILLLLHNCSNFFFNILINSLSTRINFARHFVYFRNDIPGLSEDCARRSPEIWLAGELTYACCVRR